jgi:hypothetical protein
MHNNIVPAQVQRCQQTQGWPSGSITGSAHRPFAVLPGGISGAR